MKTYDVKITLLNWWHSSSGESGAGDLDSTVVRDELGLPFLPGKALKGLFRESAQLMVDCGRLEEGALVQLFGPRIPPGESAPPCDNQAALRFSSARLPAQFRDWARANRQGKHPPEAVAGLFETLASTALDDGVAREHSLRRREVALPVPLRAKLTQRLEIGELDVHGGLETCARLIRRLGSHRHRGLGACQVAVAERKERVI